MNNTVVDNLEMECTSRDIGNVTIANSILSNAFDIATGHIL